jgi:chromosome segregation protein
LALDMMAEGSETPNGEQGSGPEGRPRRSEGDLFAERRARRAAETGEAALMRRAEAAEATVQTLERHVASLQQRMREAEQERARTDELLEAERAAALEREHELRRVKQREYAEQQLRVEAEDRLASFDRESRVEIERLSARLDASEQDARELAQRLEGVQRQLAEAEQVAASERSSVRRSEHELQLRLSELERRALEIQRGLDGERVARERSEQLLQSMREGHRRMELLLGEMKGIVARVSAALVADERAKSARSQLVRQTGPAAPPQERGAEMADALAAAVERLRARAALSPEGEAAPPADGEDDAPAGAEEAADAPAVADAHRAPLVTEAPAPAAAEVAPQASEAPTRPSAHKHSLSWFARMRIRRKQRRERRTR